MASDYRKIVAFQRADEFVIAVYRVTRSWPKEELYGLTSQVRRAAVSVAANIVEGSSRSTPPDYLHFLSIARGSLQEARYLLHLACRLGYVSEADHVSVDALCDDAGRTLWGLMEAVSGMVGKPDSVVKEDQADYLAGLCSPGTEPGPCAE